ncbi:MAG: ATP-binding protein [Gemmatimonadetes bacterium]|nr:ATP-binding protein [Gemmatimonadota bacterium]
MKKESTPSEVVVEDFGKFAFVDEGVGFEIDRSRVKQLQQYSRVIYLESPVYWKLKTALEDTRDYPVSLGERERLSGVPRYFYDLASALKFEYTGEMAFPDVYAKLTGKNVLGGRMAISETGNLSFQENGRNFSLPVTAMGIANLGILALLIERKVLDKGTFLFIDEPEAHLHPAWQVVMAESLFELSRQGVNVVIATHSADILQWLDVHVKKNPDDEQLIALNQFPVKSGKTEEDFETKMGKIMHELTKPFSDLYIEGI